jgi:hypothetical protein
MCHALARPGGRAAEGFELAMSPDALTGFLAWLEASPPGSRPTPR